MNTLKPTIALTLLLTLLGCSGQTTTTKQQSQAQEKEQEQDLVKQPPTPEQRPTEVSQTFAISPQRIMAQPAMRMVMPSIQPHYIPEQSSENYQHIVTNPLRVVSEHPVSTFSIDVDTGSYSNIRRMINQGNLPPKDAVRIEEMINYFDYQYPTPSSTNQPFAINIEMMTAPWNHYRKLLKIGLKGYEIASDKLGNANLVFLLDVSGSMNQPNKLPLLKKSLQLLTAQLDNHDRVSIVVYAGAAGVVLKPTPGNDHISINNALAQLRAGGSTHGSQGITLAYQLARQSFIKGGINRVILATDGDFNVGTTNIDTLKQLIEKNSKSGIGLTTLGFGQGNYNDYLMEQLADIGNGNYAYIDNINEARKVLVDQLSSTLQIIAKDVKIQLEFNPDQVAQYRLIGYENRQLKREDFNNDKIDAGDIGAGHTVTAIYELTMTNATNKLIDPLRYQQPKYSANKGSEIAMIKLRYKQPNSDTSQLITKIINRDLLTTKPSDDFQFTNAVMAFGELLRGGKYLENYDYLDIIELANQHKGQDDFGYRGEFIQLVRTVVSLRKIEPTTQGSTPSTN